MFWVKYVRSDPNNEIKILPVLWSFYEHELRFATQKEIEEYKISENQLKYNL